jgi:predicted RNase H-like nuclease
MNDRPTSLRHFGVDGCKGGWFYVCLENGGISHGCAPNISAILAEATAADNVFIDIPIGLLEAGPDSRLCDAEARRLLGPRASSVFNAPIRGVLDQQSYAEANAFSRELTGKGLSKQTWNICAKINEVDSVLRTDGKARKILREAHPELCFYGLAGGKPMRHNKKTEEGFGERLMLLERHLPTAGRFVAAVLACYPRSQVARDDIVDATVCALTASMSRHWHSVPVNARRDAEGLAMEIVYCQP